MMKKKTAFLLLGIITIFIMSACGNKKEIAGSWHLVEAAGKPLGEYAESIGLNEILMSTTYTINEDGTFSVINGLSIAAGQEPVTGTWKYEGNTYILVMNGSDNYQAELKDGKLNIAASDGVMVFEPGAADIDESAAKEAYESLAANDTDPAEPDDDDPEKSPEPEKPEDNTPSPGAVEETEKPSEETPEPQGISSSDVYESIIGKVWVDKEENYYDFYDDNTCYVQYKNGNEMTGEYQLIDDADGIILDIILNESEQIYTLSEMKEDSLSFTDQEGNEFTITRTEG